MTSESEASGPSFAEQIADVVALQRGRSELSHESRRSIEERSHDLRSERRLIDAELERLQAEMHRLFDRRRYVDRELDVNQSMLAPIRKLPSELLSEIFTQAVLILPPDAWTCYVVRVLCNVCATWRDVARDTPFLWTAIDLELLEEGGAPLVHLQLNLSGRLGLKICASGNYKNLRASCREAFFAELSDVDAARINWLKVRDDGHGLSRLPARPFNDLRLADITVVDGYDPHALDFLNHAPALRNLTVYLDYQCTDDEVLQGFPVPHFPAFPCLTHLSLCFYNSFPVSAFVETLSNLAPSLCEIRMEATWDASWEERTPNTTCEMPALRTADLEVYTHRLLDYITAPVLDAVTLRGYCSTDPTESLLNLLSRSRPPLRAFSLDDLSRGTADTLLRCLNKMESLRELKIENDGYDAESVLRVAAMLRQLICEKDKRPALPELKTFSLNFRSADGPSIDLEVKSPLWLMRWSRRGPRVCAGRAVVALEYFASNVDLSDTTS